MVPKLRQSLLTERGQALVDYAIIVALIGACLVAIIGLVGRATRNAYDRSASTISNQNSSYPATGLPHHDGGPPPDPDDSTGAGPPDSTGSPGIP